MSESKLPICIYKKDQTFLIINYEEFQKYLYDKKSLEFNFNDRAKLIMIKNYFIMNRYINFYMFSCKKIDIYDVIDINVILSKIAEIYNINIDDIINKDTKTKISTIVNRYKFKKVKEEEEKKAKVKNSSTNKLKTITSTTIKKFENIDINNMIDGIKEFKEIKKSIENRFIYEIFPINTNFLKDPESLKNFSFPDFKLNVNSDLNHKIILEKTDFRLNQYPGYKCEIYKYKNKEGKNIGIIELEHTNENVVAYNIMYNITHSGNSTEYEIGLYNKTTTICTKFANVTLNINNEKITTTITIDLNTVNDSDKKIISKHDKNILKIFIMKGTRIISTEKIIYDEVIDDKTYICNKYCDNEYLLFGNK